MNDLTAARKRHVPLGDTMLDLVNEARAERDAARALADELAAALERALGRPYPGTDRGLGMLEHADLALQHHREARS